MNEEIEFVKPKERKYNRRSSFFQRSSVSLYSDSPTSSSSATTDSLSKSSVNTPLGKSESEYLRKLKLEKQEWKELLNQKKKQLVELKEKSAQAAPSVEFLMEEDRKFLEDKPDYLAIGRLLDNVTELVMIKERRINSTFEKINNLNRSFEDICNEQAEDTINYFLDEFGEFNSVAPAS